MSFALFASFHFVQHVTQRSENLSEMRAVTIFCEAPCAHDCSQNIFTERGLAFSIFLLTTVSIASGFKQCVQLCYFFTS